MMLRLLLALALTLGVAEAKPPVFHQGQPAASGGGAAQSCGTGTVCAQFKNGQTFITWDDVGATGPEGAATRYRVYASTSAITSSNFASASLLANYILNNSAQLFGGNPTNGTTASNEGFFNATYRQSDKPMSKLTDLGSELPDFSGLHVHTPSGTASTYFAVVSTDTADANPVFMGSVGPITESAAAPQPVKWADSAARTGETQAAIDMAVTNVPVVFDAHASSATGGCSVQHCQRGDYWQFWHPADSGFTEGRPTTLTAYLDHALTYRQNTLVFKNRDTIWEPNSSDTSTGMESSHQGLGMSPLGGTPNRFHLITARGISRMLNWALSHYSADPNQLHWAGLSMGAWGGANTGMRSTSPKFSAVWMSAPMWRMDTRSSAGWPGGTWTSIMPFRATANAVTGVATTAPNTLGSTASQVLLDNGTVWGGTGGYVDIPTWIAATPSREDPVAIWQITKTDGFASWAQQLEALNAFQTARKGHHFVWFQGAHNSETSFPARGLIDCDFTGFDLTICYSKSDYRLDRAYLAYSNSSIDDDPGTGATSPNGLQNGDYAGGVNIGFEANITTDTAGDFNFTVDNHWMDRSPTALPQTTLVSSVPASGSASNTLTSATGFQSTGTNPWFLIGGVEAVSGTLSGSTLTIGLRGQLGTTPQAHAAGASIQQFLTKPTGPNAGPFTTMTVDIALRRIQGGAWAGKTCTRTPNGGSTVSQPVTLVSGVPVLTGVVINASGPTSVACT